MMVASWLIDKNTNILFENTFEQKLASHESRLTQRKISQLTPKKRKTRPTPITPAEKNVIFPSYPPPASPSAHTKTDPSSSPSPIPLDEPAPSPPFSSPSPSPP